jgi:small subunit ribosomal protein S17
MSKHQLIGKVISNKMSKTLVVQTERTNEHPKYKRRYRIRKNYKVHNEKGDYQIGDNVLIEECRPISKDKKYRVIKKIASVLLPDNNEAIEGPEVSAELKETEQTESVNNENLKE